MTVDSDSTVVKGPRAPIERIWTRLGLAVLAGVATALAFPEAGLWPLVWVGLVPLFQAIENARFRRAFFLGWLAGLAHFLVLIYWIAYTLIQHAFMWAPKFIVDSPVLMVIVSVVVLVLMCSILALYWGLFAGLLAWLKGRGFPGIVAAPTLFVAFEFLRGLLFSGFPWMPLGNALFPALPLIQAADLIGVFGLSFIVVFINYVLYAAIVAPLPGRRRWITIGAGVTLAGLLVTYGLVRIGQVRTIAASVPKIKVAVIQGDRSQGRKWTSVAATIEYYFRQSRRAKTTSPHLIVWPETALPFPFPYNARASQKVLALARELAVPMLIGAPAYQPDGKKIYNRANLISAQGRIVSVYDKVHLVPFGEYLPLRWLIGALVSTGYRHAGGYTPGKRGTLVRLGDIRLGVLICYESIFPELARAQVAKGARLLVNITNDTWFGLTSAPLQHLAHMALRAVEHRVAVVRAANRGFSGYIDPVGRMYTMTKRLKGGGIRSDQVALMPGRTFYTRFGYLFDWACLLAALGMLMAGFIFGRPMKGGADKR